MKIKILLGLLFIIGGLLLARITISNAFSVDGIALASTNDTIASLERENMILSEQLYTMTSLTSIAQKAEDSGFVENTSQISLGDSSPIAIKQ